MLEDDLKAGVAKPSAEPPTEYDGMTDEQLREHI